MEQRSVGEYAVESLRRQVELQEILLQDLAAAVCARHGGKARRALDADRDVAERRESPEVAAGAAAEIENGKGRHALDGLQQRVYVLAHVVVARAAPEFFRALVVMRQRETADLVHALLVGFRLVHGAEMRPGEHFGLQQRL